jgi:hypothetical protein
VSDHCEKHQIRVKGDLHSLFCGQIEFDDHARCYVVLQSTADCGISAFVLVSAPDDKEMIESKIAGIETEAYTQAVRCALRKVQDPRSFGSNCVFRTYCKIDQINTRSIQYGIDHAQQLKEFADRCLNRPRVAIKSKRTREDVEDDVYWETFNAAPDRSRDHPMDL